MISSPQNRTFCEWGWLMILSVLYAKGKQKLWNISFGVILLHKMSGVVSHGSYKKVLMRDLSFTHVVGSLIGP